MKTKTLLFAAALMLGGVSFANTTAVESGEVVNIPMDGIEHTIEFNGKGTKLTVDLATPAKNEIKIMIFTEEGNMIMDATLKPKKTILDAGAIEVGTYTYRIMEVESGTVIGFGNLIKE